MYCAGATVDTGLGPCAGTSMAPSIAICRGIPAAERAVPVCKNLARSPTEGECALRPRQSYAIGSAQGTGLALSILSSKISSG